MSQAQLAAAPDRLPWLADEPAPPRRRRANHSMVGGAIAAVALVAGISYWMGARSWQPVAPDPMPHHSTTTIALPPASETADRQPQVALEPQREVAPVPQREVPIARAETVPQSRRNASPPREEPVGHSPAESPKPVAPAPQAAVPVPQVAPPATATPLAAWPAWQSEGASGRIVRIGAFGTRQQAKLGWRYMVRSYPAVSRLQATVVETRNSRGRPFYRFQIGTTSQAHSEVLCQRMKRIRLSCAVIGLPWKPKGVER